LQQRNLTLDEALKILKVVLLRCDLCPASAVKPYEYAAWSHLLKKHSKDDKFLLTAKAKATSWKASYRGRKPMKPKDLRLIVDILEDGRTSKDVEDLIKAYVATKPKRDDSDSDGNDDENNAEIDGENYYEQDGSSPSIKTTKPSTRDEKQQWKEQAKRQGNRKRKKSGEGQLGTV
jgi:hypothetical protein